MYQYLKTKTAKMRQLTASFFRFDVKANNWRRVDTRREAV